ncbi:MULTISPECIES: anti-sigma factor [Paenibacillus]|uniref:Anti-sigma-W factor RsiW n=1 Tax=Paenibacillus borealis TaxID=160799 RepID=A0ABX3H027_PAEBO|nr:anti-sigma factor [Paenibacillus borealis]OMD41629.1 hypothetical protein BSK56_26995 [Paenibacillus borealis]
MTEETNDRCELVELYVLEALPEDEMQKFEAHLMECADCSKRVKEYRSVMDLLPLASEPVQPPSGMKSRIMSRVLVADAPAQVKRSIEEEPVQALPVEREVKTVPPAAPAKKIPFWRYVSLGLAAAVLIMMIYAGQLRQDVDQLQQQLSGGTKPAQELKVDESVALSPAAKDIVASGLATIVVDSSGTHLVVQAENLPELTGTEVYQVWLIKGDTPQNAGTFVSSEGSGALYYSFKPQEYDTVAITLEPDAGGETPRGQMVLTSPIKKG